MKYDLFQLQSFITHVEIYRYSVFESKDKHILLHDKLLHSIMMNYLFNWLKLFASIFQIYHIIAYNSQQHIDMFRQPQKQIGSHLPQKGQSHGNSDNSRRSSENQSSQSNIQSLSQNDSSDQLSESSPPIEAAIKTMTFRKKRGTKMKDLLKGQINPDAFWQRNCRYFGGDLRNKDDQEDEEDYQQSSSGQDQFDSDFNNTDSYVGKRGRKKGTKVKKRATGSGRRGRPKKERVQRDEASSSQSKEKVQKPKRGRKQKKKEQKIEGVKHKIIYKRLHEKPQDYFLILKATIPSKRGRKPKGIKETDEKIPQPGSDEA